MTGDKRQPAKGDRSQRHDQTDKSPGDRSRRRVLLYGPSAPPSAVRCRARDGAAAGKGNVLRSVAERKDSGG